MRTLGDSYLSKMKASTVWYLPVAEYSKGNAAIRTEGAQALHEGRGPEV
jgi:hypothetical protein